MRRLPVYLLLDTSGSMMGEPIEAVKNGVQSLLSALKTDPYALETVSLSVVTFSSGAQQIVPMTELPQFQAPELDAQGQTELGAGLRLVAERADTEVNKNTPERKGDWKPMVFLMTDGMPTDRNWRDGLAEFRKRRWGLVVCCAAGSNCDTSVLQEVSPPTVGKDGKTTSNVVGIDATDTGAWKAFFKWVTQSIVEGTKSVKMENKDVSGVSQLPPPPPEVTLVT